MPRGQYSNFIFFSPGQDVIGGDRVLQILDLSSWIWSSLFNSDPHAPPVMLDVSDPFITTDNRGIQRIEYLKKRTIKNSALQLGTDLNWTIN